MKNCVFKTLSPNLFENCEALTKIELPSCLEVIGTECFHHCSSLKSIDIPENVSQIYQAAFGNCLSLESIELPSKLVIIESSLFAGCNSLTNIVIPDNVTFISDNAFEGCLKLTTIHLPSNLIEMGSGVFTACIKIESLDIPSSCQTVHHDIFDECLSLTKVNYPVNEFGYYDSIVWSEDYNSLKNSFKKIMITKTEDEMVELNDIIVDKDFNWIDHDVYSDNDDLIDVYIPDHVRNVDSCCFARCYDLTSIVIPQSVTSIGHKLFMLCVNLQHVTLSDNLDILPNASFKDCRSLKSIHLSSSLQYIGMFCFDGCTSLTSLEFPPKCEIDKGVIQHCSSLQNLSVPNENKIVSYQILFTEKDIYEKCGYKPNNIIANTKACFNELQNLEAKITLLGSAIDHTKESIIIPTTVTEITDDCFKNCEKLQSLTIPSSVISIDDECFLNCPNLKELTIPSTVTQMGEFLFGKDLKFPEKLIFEGKKHYGIVTVPEYELYKQHNIECLRIKSSEKDFDKYGRFPSFVNVLDGLERQTILIDYTIPSQVKELYYRCFALSENLTRIVIPSTVTKIYCECFNACFNLQEIVLEAQITKLEDKLFANCKNLTSFTIPTTIKEIGDNVFHHCVSLEEVSIPSTVTKIGMTPFEYCYSLKRLIIDPQIQITSISSLGFGLNDVIKELSLPTSVTKIEDGLFFWGSTGISSITLPNVNHIGMNVFKCCFNLKTIDLPTTLTCIDSFAFDYCISLKTIHIPENVKIIGDRIFNHCTSLTSVHFPTSISSIDNLDIHLFDECISLKEIYIGNEKISTYPFKVSYSIMKQLKRNGIECPEVVLTHQDVMNKEIEILQDFTIPTEIKYLEDNCFRNQLQLSRVIIPSNIISLGEKCFFNCANLEIVVLPSTLTFIPSQCFCNCSLLREIRFESTNMKFGEKCFMNCYQLIGFLHNINAMDLFEHYRKPIDEKSIEKEFKGKCLDDYCECCGKYLDNESEEEDGGIIIGDGNGNLRKINLNDLPMEQREHLINFIRQHQMAHAMENMSVEEEDEEDDDMSFEEDDDDYDDNTSFADESDEE